MFPKFQRKLDGSCSHVNQVMYRKPVTYLDIKGKVSKPVKVARTSFLAQGVDHHCASPMRNMNDRGARLREI